MSTPVCRIRCPEGSTWLAPFRSLARLLPLAARSRPRIPRGSPKLARTGWARWKGLIGQAKRRWGTVASPKAWTALSSAGGASRGPMGGGAAVDGMNATSTTLSQPG